MTAARPAASASDDRWFALLEGELRSYLARRVDSRALVDDLLQEALLRIVGGLAEVKHAERLGGWAFTVARHTLIDHYRRVQRELPVDMTEAEPPAEPLAEPDSAAARMLSAWLPGAIDSLSEPYRSTLRATELDGESYAALAVREGVSVSAIKSRVVRGRQKLRQAAERCCDIKLDARGHVVELRGRRCGCSG